MQYERTRESQLPLELIEEVRRAHVGAIEEDTSSQDIEPYVFVVVHEKQQRRRESEFIIKGVFHTLSSANVETMDIFESQYPNYPRSCFYAQGTWQLIGENLVGWYVSRNGTLSLEIHDSRGNTCRIYAEKHYVE
jgi:hypothetical protein